MHNNRHRAYFRQGQNLPLNSICPSLGAINPGKGEGAHLSFLSPSFGLVLTLSLVVEE